MVTSYRRFSIIVLFCTYDKEEIVNTYQKIRPRRIACKLKFISHEAGKLLYSFMLHNGKLFADHSLSSHACVVSNNSLT